MIASCSVSNVIAPFSSLPVIFDIVTSPISNASSPSPKERFLSIMLYVPSRYFVTVIVAFCAGAGVPFAEITRSSV